MHTVPLAKSHCYIRLLAVQLFSVYCCCAPHVRLLWPLRTGPRCVCNVSRHNLLLHVHKLRFLHFPDILLGGNWGGGEHRTACKQVLFRTYVDMLYLMHNNVSSPWHWEHTISWCLGGWAPRSAKCSSWFYFCKTCVRAALPLWLVAWKYVFVALSLNFSIPCWVNGRMLPCIRMNWPTWHCMYIWRYVSAMVHFQEFLYPLSWFHFILWNVIFCYVPPQVAWRKENLSLRDYPTSLEFSHIHQQQHLVGALWSWCFW